LADLYRVGEGLVTFSSTDQAIAGARNILENYHSHALAARQLAETYFDSNQVLGKLIDEAGICP
jgi:hypothetical protein